MVAKKGYIDALKGIAIIAITLTHIGGGNLPGIFGEIANHGARGVQMFFVISAMLAFASLERKFPSRKGMKLKNVLKWLWDKYLRLAPMFYLAIIISMLTGSWSSYWLGSEGHVTVKNIFTHILFIHGFFPHYTDSVLGIEWYLGVLVIFYVLTPIIYYFIDSLGKSIALLVSVQVIAPWLNYHLSTFYPKTTDQYIYDTFIGTFGPLANLYVYCVGIVVYFMVKQIDAFKKTDSQGRWLSYSLLAFAAVMLWGQIKYGNSLYRLSDNDVFGIWFAIVIISQSIHSCILIDNPFFRLCGKYSYGIYLFQYIVIRFYGRYLDFDFMNPIVLSFVFCLLGLLGASYIVTRFLDGPIQKKLKGIYTKNL